MKLIMYSCEQPYVQSAELESLENPLRGQHVGEHLMNFCGERTLRETRNALSHRFTGDRALGGLFEITKEFVGRMMCLISNVS
jgi:hypothetical protein